MTERDDEHPVNQYHAERLKAALCLARAMIPQGTRLPGANLRTVLAAEKLAVEMSAAGRPMFKHLVGLLDWAAVLRTGRRFQNLSPLAQEKLIRNWEQSPVWRWPLFGLGGILKTAHFDHPEVYEAFEAEHKLGGPAEPARWTQQVQSGEELEADDVIECDVVVMGSGAGGAIVGRELAEQGHAVVFLEEGKLYRRDAFTGSSLIAHQKFYRGQGKVASWGNTMVPVLMGKLVGGSTAINTGTSFRAPDWILDEWCERLQTDELAPHRMQRHFDAVSRQIEVGINEDKYIGPIGKIVARGCDNLGWSHFKVPRNAPDCDAQGRCDFGCPSAARRSMDISILPKAFARGAVLFTETKGTRVLIEKGRAVGLEARTTRSGKTLTFRAQAVILAGGAVPTPALLLGQGICNRSGQVGRNLSLHPGGAVSGLFEEKVDGFRHIPQGVGIDQFHRDGILLLGAQCPINVGALIFPYHGQRLTEIMDAFDHIGTLGVLVKDATQNGTVRVGMGGEPLITYWLQREDLEQVKRGVAYIMEMFFAAGATRCYPLGHRMPVVETERELEQFRNRTVGPSDFIWTSFHPLGTVAMGADPNKSVVDFDHETHDVRGLFVVDGSTVPGPTAVNPQLTVMAMAHRAAERIHAKLDG
ncbi:MAG: GMC family oxidoreductase [bacterium]